jgi:hypothetical protein
MTPSEFIGKTVRSMRLRSRQAMETGSSSKWWKVLGFENKPRILLLIHQIAWYVIDYEQMIQAIVM